jgi:hypothetical protein
MRGLDPRIHQKESIEWDGLPGQAPAMTLWMGETPTFGYNHRRVRQRAAGTT